MDQNTLNIIYEESDIILTEIVAFLDDYKQDEQVEVNSQDRVVFKEELKKHLVKLVAKLQSNG